MGIEETNWKKKFKHYYILTKNSTAYAWTSAIVNVLLLIFVLELITGGSSVGKTAGWFIVLLVLGVNAYGIYKARHFLKGFWRYIMRSIEGVKK